MKSKRPKPKTSYRVVIDGRMVGEVPHGIARYVERLAHGLSLLNQEASLPYEPIFLASARIKKTFHGFQTQEMKFRFLHPLEWVEVPRALVRWQASLYHSPSFSSLPYTPVPWVATVHDLNHLRFGGFKERTYYRLLLKRFAKNAEALVTVSEFSRRELSSWTGLSLVQIEMVPNALDPELTEVPTAQEIDKTLKKLNLKRHEYFVCISNAKPHRNLSLLMEAFSTYRSDPMSLEWPIATNVKELSERPGVHYLGYPTDLEVRSLYAGAGAALFPSVYEGFGLPPVEAACLGVPLIVSNIPSHEEGLSLLEMAEVCWVSPWDLAGWAHAMRKAGRGELRPVGDQSRCRVLARYDSIHLGRSMDRIYRRVLGLEI